MKITRQTAWVLVIGLACSACSTMGDPAAPAELKLQNLMEQSLAAEFVADREVVISYVELPPNTSLERHWHPGEEFHYYLDGKVEIVVDGEPTIVGVPGQVGHIPYKKMHTAVTGPEGARVVVFRVHTKGEPVRYLEKGGSAEQ